MIKTPAMAMALALFLGAALGMQCGVAAAAKPVSCLGDEAPPGKPPGSVLKEQQDGADLVVSIPCTVLKGTYKFRDVHIVANGTLTFDDDAIHFWAANILIENGGSLVAGDLSAPIGTNGGTVTFHLWGDDKTGSDPKKEGVGIPCISDGVGQCGVPDEIWKSNAADPASCQGASAACMPGNVDQARKIAKLPSASKYPGVTDDYFYAYRPLPFDGGTDADHPTVGYFGYKVIGVSYGGTLKLFGRKGATYAKPECGAAPTTSGTSWARLDGSVAAGASTLTLDRAVSLKTDDQIVVTTTDYLPGHSEQLTVAADVVCGKTVTVKEAFQWPHNGTKFALASRVPVEAGLEDKLRTDGAETRAAVGLLTRSIRIVSAGNTMNDDFPPEPAVDSAAPGYYFGGHVVARQGFKTFQVQGVEFAQLGQGGRIGHYPVHFHHARRTPTDTLVETFVRDSSIHDSMTRWIVLHGTQDVKLERNVGYKSIGHGFYLEDGTEINNTLTANLGVFARAAVANVQNRRKVPGILAAPNLQNVISEDVPYRSDYDHPTVFWVMNAYNDFKDNMAAGAGACGVCYWFLPAYNSTMSRDMRWDSYASIQTGAGRASTAPLKSFVGNGCTSAMTSFQTIKQTEACLGVGPDGPFPTLTPVPNPLATPSKAPEGSPDPVIKAAAAAAADYYPNIDDGGRFPTKCTTEDCRTSPVRCSAGSPGGCLVTELDHYTTSFNWAAFNFAAIWLRPQWYLVTDSVITDAQQAGLTIVTGGGYSESDVIPGHWGLVRRSVFIGSTQDQSASGNPFAYNGGPFNPQPSARYPEGLRCATNANKTRPGNYCLSIDEGVSHQMSNFGMYQRLFSVYDGPAFQESNAYLDITKRTINDCKPFDDTQTPAGRCDPVLKPNSPTESAWVAGFVSGLPKAKPDPANTSTDYCYMPNAAIGWKQPNGFYYPPAFHSANLFFDNVDIRHFVVSPPFIENSYTPDVAALKAKYCIWNKGLFTGFAGNDRQTVLNDDDGTLTGYEKTTVINLDDFFNAPVDAKQCRSESSSRTSPYDYVTTVLYPRCVFDPSSSDPTCAKAPVVAPDPNPNPNWNYGDWNRACTSDTCYGIPLWRQDLMPIADKGSAKSIRMMGQETGQRSSLTVNHGTYYIDTTVSKETQLVCSSTKPDNPCVINVFKPNETYYLFLIFAKGDTEQTYRFYAGDDFDLGSVQMVRAQIGKNPVVFTPPQPLPTGRVRWLNDNKATAKGVVEVVLKVSDLLPDLPANILAAKKNKCQPSTYCTWNDATSKCTDLAGSDAVCKWAVADLDCPDGGCYGIKFTLPGGFKTRAPGDPDPRPPAAPCVDKAAPWDVSLDDLKQPGDVCPVETDKLPADFCPAPKRKR